MILTITSTIAVAHLICLRLDSKTLSVTETKISSNGKLSGIRKHDIGRPDFDQDKQVELIRGEAAPDGRWVAIEASSSTSTWLSILDLQKNKVVSTHQVPERYSYRWFRWASADTLVWIEPAPQHAGRNHNLLFAKAPRWDTTLTLSSATRADAEEDLLKNMERMEHLSERAASCLDNLHDRILIPPSGDDRGAPSASGWAAYLRVGADSAISEDGNAIAVLADRWHGRPGEEGRTDPRSLYLLQKRNNWEERSLGAMRYVRYLQFAGSWLIIGEGTIAREQPMANNSAPTASNPITRLVSLSDTTKSFSLRCDIIAIVPSVQHLPQKPTTSKRSGNLRPE